MEFKIQRKENENVHRYATENVGIARKFAKHLQKELGDFLVGVVIFGSAVRREETEKSDIDILVVTDDTQFVLTQELVEGYRVIIETSIRSISPKLHITSMTYTSFWEYIKAGDPVAVNILRDGYPLTEGSFFVPLQQLLKQGRIRPSEESIWRYFGRAPKTLLNSRWHVLQGALDLYWAVIDSAHAALMRRDVVPPTPDHVADELEKVYVKRNLLDKKYVTTMRKFYKLSKMITHRDIREISGADFEKYYYEADDFVKKMKSLIMKGRY